MNEESFKVLLIYGIASLLLVDYYDGYTPSYKMIAQLMIKSNSKMFFYTFYFAVKKQWLLCVMGIGVVLVYTTIFQNIWGYVFYLFYLFVVSPYFFYYTPYEYIRYALFILPLGNLYFHSFVYSFACLIVTFLVSLFIYRRVAKEGKEKKDRKVLSIQAKFCFPMLLFVLIILSKFSIFQRLPIEQIGLSIIFYIFMMIERDVFSDKKMLRVSRSKAYLNIVKSSHLTLRFLKEADIEKLKRNLLWIFLFSIFLGLQSGIYIDYIILFISAIVLIMANADLFLYHFIFQRSIAYQNKVVRNVIVMSVNALIIQYSIYYMAMKWIGENKINNEITIVFRLIFLFLFLFLSVIFILRYLNLFKINKKNNSRSNQ